MGIFPKRQFKDHAKLTCYTVYGGENWLSVDYVLYNCFAIYTHVFFSRCACRSLVRRVLEGRKWSRRYLNRGNYSNRLLLGRVHWWCSFAIVITTYCCRALLLLTPIVFTLRLVLFTNMLAGFGLASQVFICASDLRYFFLGMPHKLMLLPLF